MLPSEIRGRPIREQAFSFVDAAGNESWFVPTVDKTREKQPRSFPWYFVVQAGRVVQTLNGDDGWQTLKIAAVAFRDLQNNGHAGDVVVLTTARMPGGKSSFPVARVFLSAPDGRLGESRELSNVSNGPSPAATMATALARLRSDKSAKRRVSAPSTHREGVSWHYKMFGEDADDRTSVRCTGEATLRHEQDRLITYLEPPQPGTSCFSWHIGLPLCVGDIGADGLHGSHQNSFTLDAAGELSRTICLMGTDPVFADDDSAPGGLICHFGTAPFEKVLPDSFDVDCELRRPSEGPGFRGLYIFSKR